MGILAKMLKQSAVYWAKTGIDGYGKAKYDNPVEISCRWEDVAEEYLSARNTREMSNAVVYSDRDLVVGGVLMLGELSSSGVDWDVPKNNDGAWEIKRFDKLPTLKATKFLRTAYL